MKNESFPVVGIDIGGTKIAVCVADPNGTILASERVEGGTQKPYASVLPDIVEMIKAAGKEAGIEIDQLAACGVSAPGPLNIPEGVIEKTPNMVWDDVPIRDDLHARLGIPVILQNDANGGALAEWYFGAAKGCEDFFYLTMSTGIGGGIISAGQLVEGVDGNAGELGHVVIDINGPKCGCGMNGCFEAFCSGRNVQKRLQELVKGQPDHPLLQQPEVGGDPQKLKFETLRAAVQRNVPEACQFWDDLCLRMAQGIGIHMMTFNPELIILGTIFYYSGDTLMQPVKEKLDRFAWPQMRKNCQLELPALGKKIGEMAGVAVALYGLKKGGDS
ncbi:MAG: ROK family protein [Lentisphaeria bacterium]